MLIHITICPYTKVEESFNIQAIHDILYHGTDLDKYDHHDFPGVVPRTFLGPLLISALAYPFIFVCRLLQYNKFISQFIVRSVLGLVTYYCYRQYHKAVRHKLGKNTAQWLHLLTITQFHFLFYASRTLPNVFALMLTLLSLSSWLRGSHRRLIWSGACAIIIFRSELCLLLGPILLLELLQRRLSMYRLLTSAIPAGITWLCLSVVVDSYFWRRWLWPEGEVLWFNIVLNKSSEWGTSPYLWYIYSVLPRALGASVVFVPLSWCVDRRAMYITGSALVFILLYSVLPHKELRFIIYVFPLFNTAAAILCSRIWQNRVKTICHRLFALMMSTHLLFNLALTSGFIYVSRLNYPGGYAIDRLHKLETNETDVHVHIDVFTAQTGVTRFTQLNDNWEYSKVENLLPDSDVMMSFTHLFIAASSPDDPKLQPYKDTHIILETIKGFSGVAFMGRKFPPLAVKVEPKIFLLKRA